MSTTTGTRLKLTEGRYDEHDRAVLDGFANRVTGTPDIEGMLGKLRVQDGPQAGQPYQDEEELLRDRGIDNLFGLFFRGSLGENIRRLEKEIFPDRIGSFRWCSS